MREAILACVALTPTPLPEERGLGETGSRTHNWYMNKHALGGDSTERVFQ
jgi:hypothetical protein